MFFSGYNFFNTKIFYVKFYTDVHLAMWFLTEKRLLKPRVNVEAALYFQFQ